MGVSQGEGGRRKKEGGNLAGWGFRVFRLQ